MAENTCAGWGSTTIATVVMAIATVDLGSRYNDADMTFAMRCRMPSPFPGMNPYLEQEDVWNDFHASMMPAISEVLSPQISPYFMVRIKRYFYIHEPNAEQRIGMGTPVESEFHRFLEIRDCKNHELVTVIELLSPTNKRPGLYRAQYIAQRADVLRGTAHFVEIDLLRGSPTISGDDVPACDYSVMVSVVGKRPNAAYWPIALEDPLPVVPIPLRETAPAVRLDLQQVLHLIYDRAFYKDYIYEGLPTPPLSPEQIAWAQSLISP